MRLSFAICSDFADRAFARGLYKEYIEHARTGSAGLLTALNVKIQLVAIGLLVPVLTLLGASFLTLGVILALIAVNPQLQPLSHWWGQHLWPGAGRDARAPNEGQRTYVQWHDRYDARHAGCDWRNT